MGTELTLTFPPNPSIAYKKLGALDGAQHPIPDAFLLEAVNWIDKQVKTGKRKVLVNCRAGIGRSGSVSVAYCFYKNPRWSYQQTLDYIWSKKSDIYPHKHPNKAWSASFSDKNSTIIQYAKCNKYSDYSFFSKLFIVLDQLALKHV